MHRERGKNALRLKLKKEENVVIFEKYIHQNYGEDVDTYNHNLYEVVNELTIENMHQLLTDIKQKKYGWDQFFEKYLDYDKSLI